MSEVKSSILNPAPDLKRKLEQFKEKTDPHEADFDTKAMEKITQITSAPKNSASFPDNLEHLEEK